MYLTQKDDESKNKYAKLAVESVKEYSLGLMKAKELKILGNKLYAESKLEDALTIYGQALILDQNNIPILSNLAHVNYLLGNNDRGLEYALKCTLLDPTFARVTIIIMVFEINEIF